MSVIAPGFATPGRSWATATALALFLAIGAIGAYRYVDNYWVYRGFAPPRDAAFVKERGTSTRFYVASPALGGRRQPVDVYLPPGYAAHPHRRYPVTYLLHGFPGRPGAFLATVRMGVVEDELVALHRTRPLILVMPFGSTGSFTDKEWANGIGKELGLGDVRRARRGAGGRHALPHDPDRDGARVDRPLGGRLRRAEHRHPPSRRVPRARKLVGLRARRPHRSRSSATPHVAPRGRTAALDSLTHATAALRRAKTYFWFYSGTDDQFRTQNATFAARAEGALGCRTVTSSYAAATTGRCGAGNAARALPRRLAEARWLRRLAALPGAARDLARPRPAGCTSCSLPLPGPRLGEALPLDELAKHSSAPLLWYLAVWLAAALTLGVYARKARLERLTAALLLGLATGLFGYAETGVSIAVVRQIPLRDALDAASRLQAIYVPAALVALAVAALAPARARGQRAPLLVASVVAVGAVLEPRCTRSCRATTAASSTHSRPTPSGRSHAPRVRSPRLRSSSRHAAWPGGAAGPGRSRRASRASRRRSTCAAASTTARSPP